MVSINIYDYNYIVSRIHDIKSKIIIIFQNAQSNAGFNLFHTLLNISANCSRVALSGGRFLLQRRGRLQSAVLKFLCYEGQFNNLNALFSSSNEIHFSYNSITNYIWAVVVPLHIPDVNYTTGEKYIISNPFPNATFKFFPKYNGWDKKKLQHTIVLKFKKIYHRQLCNTYNIIYLLIVIEWFFPVMKWIFLRISNSLQSVTATTGRVKSLSKHREKFYFAKNSRVWRDPRRLSISMGLLKSLVTFLWY